jgi:hypothetical protein
LILALVIFVGSVSGPFCGSEFILIRMRRSSVEISDTGLRVEETIKVPTVLKASLGSDILKPRYHAMMAGSDDEGVWQAVRHRDSNTIT